MKLDTHAPLVGVPACAKDVDGLPFHVVGDKYVAALVEAAGALPLLIPALGPLLDGPDVVDRLDGLMLTGSISNVATYPPSPGSTTARRALGGNAWSAHRCVPELA